MNKKNLIRNVQEFWIVTESGIVKVEMSNKIDKKSKGDDFAKKLVAKKSVRFNLQEKRTIKRVPCSAIICQPFHAIHKLCTRSKDVVVI